MNLEGFIQNANPLGGVRLYPNYNVSNLYNRSGDKASFGTQLDKFLDRNVILSKVYSNPAIINILKSNNIPIKPDISSFNKHVYQHSIDTKKIATGIYKHLPENLKSKANLKDIADGAVLHDIGKVLIPSSILGKEGALSEKERDIMELHSTLSYELLRENGVHKGVNENVLNIIKYHHQTPNNTGYPKTDETQSMNLDAQIVSLADKYSALTEKRCYKPKMSSQQALEIIKQEMKDGGMPDDLYTALCNYVHDNEKSKNAATLSNYINNKAPQVSRMFIA